MVGIRREGEAGRCCRKFRGNGGRGTLLHSAVAQPGCELFVQGQRRLSVFRNDFSGGLLGRGGKSRVTARAAIVAMFMVVQNGVRLGGRLNLLK